MRLEGWETRMMEYMTHAATQEFEYGVIDCVVMACDHVENTTGIDPLDGGGRGPDGRGGAWTNPRDGVALIRKYRGSYEGILDFYFNRYGKPGAAQRGDVALKKIDGLNAFGIVGTGGKVYFKAPGKGLVSHPVTGCDLAWRIE